jgi:ankyrin repeat protein
LIDHEEYKFMLREALPIIAFKQKKNSSSISAKKKHLVSAGGFFTEYQGMLIYPSGKGTGKYSNGKALDQFGKQIVCRHLSGNIVNSIRADGRVMKDYHDIYASSKEIAKVTYLKENHYDTKRIAYNSTYYNIFDLNTLGATLSKVAGVLKGSEETSLLFDSENHTMAFTVIRKEAVDGPQYIIKFYDPNKTDNHTRIICNSLDDMKNLSINHLLKDASIKSYFQSHKYVALFSPKQRVNAEEPLVDLSGSNVGAQLIYCMWFGLSNVIPSLVTKYLANGGPIIFPTTSRGTHLLTRAGMENHFDAINKFINTINKSDLNPIAKNMILDINFPTLINATKTGKEDIVKQLIEFGRVNPNNQDMGKDTALHWALNQNNEPISLYLIEHSDITIRGLDKKNALDHAFESKNFNVIFAILKKGLSLHCIQQRELLSNIDKGSHALVCDYIASKYESITENDSTKFERLMKLLKDAGKDDIVEKIKPAEQQQEIKNAKQFIAFVIDEIQSFAIGFNNQTTVEEVGSRRTALLRQVNAILEDNQQELTQAYQILGLNQFSSGVDYAIRIKKEEITEKTDKTRLLIDIKFDEHLNKFKRKANEMNVKAEFDSNYKKAGIKANEFCFALERARQRFLDNHDDTSQNAKTQFKDDCDGAVRDAREILDAHREWKGAILKFCINVISFITRGLTDSKLGIFAKTASSTMLDTFEKNINNSLFAQISC